MAGRAASLQRGVWFEGPTCRSPALRSTLRGMSGAAERVVRFEELWEALVALPEGVTGEIVSAGTIETMSRPGRAHRRAAGALAFGAGGRLGAASRGWVIEAETEVRFGELLFVPDLAGWRLDERGDEFLDATPIERAPTWVCEILSPNTRDKDRNRKLPRYLEHAVEAVWLVDPEDRSIEVFTAEGGAGAPVTRVTEPPETPLPPADLPLDPSALWAD